MESELGNVVTTESLLSSDVLMASIVPILYTATAAHTYITQEAIVPFRIKKTKPAFIDRVSIIL
jgi:hypothetical protein